MYVFRYGERTVQMTLSWVATILRTRKQTHVCFLHHRTTKRFYVPGSKIFPLFALTNGTVCIRPTKTVGRKADAQPMSCRKGVLEKAAGRLPWQAVEYGALATLDSE